MLIFFIYYMFVFVIYTEIRYPFDVYAWPLLIKDTLCMFFYLFIKVKQYDVIIEFLGIPWCARVGC